MILEQEEEAKRKQEEEAKRKQEEQRKQEEAKRKQEEEKQKVQGQKNYASDLFNYVCTCYVHADILLTRAHATIGPS